MHLLQEHYPIRYLEEVEAWGKKGCPQHCNPWHCKLNCPLPLSILSEGRPSFFTFSIALLNLARKLSSTGFAKERHSQCKLCKASLLLHPLKALCYKHHRSTYHNGEENQAWLLSDISQAPYELMKQSSKASFQMLFKVKQKWRWNLSFTCQKTGT